MSKLSKLKILSEDLKSEKVAQSRPPPLEPRLKPAPLCAVWQGSAAPLPVYAWTTSADLSAKEDYRRWKGRDRAETDCVPFCVPL